MGPPYLMGTAETKVWYSLFRGPLYRGVGCREVFVITVALYRAGQCPAAAVRVLPNLSVSITQWKHRKETFSTPFIK